MRTETKAFCGCSTAYGSDPNANVCPVCLGHPGVLPVLNGKLVEFVMRMGIATHCRIRERSTFARKNYFYPDLPKGYQISQYEDPICHDGWIEIEQPDETRRRIGITRIHMEEDAGKSIHDSSDFTLVDLNRCGIPLIEIVSQPDLRSPEEAYLYLTQIRRIVTYLGICDGNMEEGSLRCDANVSIRKKGDTAFGTKTELKNMNSFRNVERALAFEIDRQTEILETGGTVVQETLLWDAGKNVAVSMRSKEEAHDYRYFPEPDLVPVHVTEEWKRTLAASLPELPLERRDRFMREYSLPRYDADVLTSEAGLADYYEGICRAVEPKNAETFRSAGNWVQGDFLRLMKEKRRELSDNPFPASHLAELVNLIGSGAVSGKMGKEILEEMFDTGENPSRIIERKGMAQVSDTAVIEPIIDKILAENPDSIRKYFKGRTQVFGFFVGQVMKETKGQANPQRVNEILTAKLEQMKGKE